MGVVVGYITAAFGKLHLPLPPPAFKPKGKPPRPRLMPPGGNAERHGFFFLGWPKINIAMPTTKALQPKIWRPTSPLSPSRSNAEIIPIIPATINTAGNQ